MDRMPVRSCFNSGHRIEDHFVDVTEMIEIGNYCPDFLAKLSVKRIFQSLT